MKKTMELTRSLAGRVYNAARASWNSSQPRTPNANFSARRVVLGGTGQFRDLVGEIKEENIEENSTGFRNLPVTFLVKRVKAEMH